MIDRELDPVYERHVLLQDQPIDLAGVRHECPNDGRFGGYVSFEGVVRSLNEGKAVDHIDYSAYDAMAYLQLEKIIAKAQAEHQVAFVRLVHRLGRVDCGQTAVVLICLGRHRREAYACSMQIMSQLKRDVPIWKKEYYRDGSFDWPRCHHDHAAPLSP